MLFSPYPLNFVAKKDLLQAGLVLFQYHPSHWGNGANGGPQPERRWLGWFFLGDLK